MEGSFKLLRWLLPPLLLLWESEIHQSFPFLSPFFTIFYVGHVTPLFPVVLLPSWRKNCSRDAMQDRCLSPLFLVGNLQFWRLSQKVTAVVSSLGDRSVGLMWCGAGGWNISHSPHLKRGHLGSQESFQSKAGMSAQFDSRGSWYIVDLKLSWSCTWEGSGHSCLKPLPSADCHCWASWRTSF